MLPPLLDRLVGFLIRGLLSLRYRVRLRGLAPVAQRGRRGILFLPNHPALIDPVLLVTHLHPAFAPRPVADRDQVDRFLIRGLARRIGTYLLPDLRRYGPAVRDEVQAVLRQVAADLRGGQNVLLYPSGHLARSRYEDLGGNSAVEALLRAVPDVRVVLVRTRGLWGSAFSLAGSRRLVAGDVPSVAAVLRRAAGWLLANLVFFGPRREVTIELHEPADLPRPAADPARGGPGPPVRAALNAYLAAFYNADAPPALYVPYTRWERGGPRPLPEPELGGITAAAAQVPANVRALVSARLRELTGAADFRDEQRLAEDLGLDSLAKAELVLWLGQQFGFREADVDALRTVGDVLLATRGEAVVSRPVAIRPPPARWFSDASGQPIVPPGGDTLMATFLEQAAREPGRLIVADQLSGARSYRDLITAILVLRPRVATLPGERIGILLPASVAAAMSYLTVLFAGRTPVLLNWTTGPRNLAHCLELTGVQRILTAGPFVRRLAAQGVELPGLTDRLVLLEDLRRQAGRAAQWRAFAASRLSWASLAATRGPQTAAILVTSGSETLPKAVPLSHANLLANLRDVVRVLTIRTDDRLIGFLPPFHSFGLTVTLLAPLVAGIRTVYHANPTEAWMLTKLIESYGVTLLVGTPTFLYGLVRAARPAQLAALRLAVTGAEKCPERVYRALAECCPQATVLEGYGITECSPIVAVNRVEDPRPGTIGRVLPALEYAIVDPETGAAVPPGETGLLLVRGPSVFAGYLGREVASPFVEYAGRTWYRTGDLVSADAGGVLTFRGRLKRFVKLGGEMISLPAIEAVLDEHYPAQGDEGPALAVVATPNEEHPELVLFTTRDLERAVVNQQIRAAGLSALHNLSCVVRVPQIPLLGTGKTDYRALAERLERVGR